MRQRANRITRIAAGLLLATLLAACSGLPRTGETAEPVLSSWHAYLQSRFRLRSSKGEKIPVLMLLPAGSDRRCPAVVALHGLGDSKESWLEIDGYAKGGNVTLSLLESGLAVIAIDLRFQGERSAAAEESGQWQALLRRWGWFYEGTLADVRQVVGHLESHQRVDPVRIELIGFHRWRRSWLSTTAVTARRQPARAWRLPGFSVF